MKKKGFTLVELLAVIVILAVIALIAVPQVLNMIEKARIGAAEDSAYSYVNGIEDTLVANYINGHDYTPGEYKVGDIDVNIKGTYPTLGTYILDNNNMVTEAKLCINNYSIYYDGKVSSNKKDENYCISNSNAPSKSYTIVNDLNSNDSADVGDEISVGTEHFYVIATSDSNIKALAKHNLKVGYYYDDYNRKDYELTDINYGIQDENVKGYVDGSGQDSGMAEFANNKYWDNVDFSVDGLVDLTNSSSVINRYLVSYKSYLGEKVSDVTLITRTELENLGCSTENFTCKDALYSWVYSTSYFTRSIGGTTPGIYNVGIDKSFNNTHYSSSNGVRPVIVISK